MRAYLDTMIGKYEKPYADVVDGRLRNADPEAFDDSRVAMRRNSIWERTGPGNLEEFAASLGHRDVLDLPGLKNVMVQSTGTWMYPAPRRTRGCGTRRRPSGSPRTSSRPWCAGCTTGPASC
ncbi:hypothetical protein [Saccharopolyspora gregorii]|uniref:Uncharacterized protein n=1 Tax=Saccharopolyspora gregorii TaxID=33914 RepID=A0ABP6S442_9PSEU